MKQILISFDPFIRECICISLQRVQFKQKIKSKRVEHMDHKKMCNAITSPASPNLRVHFFVFNSCFYHFFFVFTGAI